MSVFRIAHGRLNHFISWEWTLSASSKRFCRSSWIDTFPFIIRIESDVHNIQITYESRTIHPQTKHQSPTYHIQIIHQSNINQTNHSSSHTVRWISNLRYCQAAQPPKTKTNNAHKQYDIQPSRKLSHHIWTWETSNLRHLWLTRALVTTGFRMLYLRYKYLSSYPAQVFLSQPQPQDLHIHPFTFQLHWFNRRKTET